MGSYTPTEPGNSWAVTHAEAGLTGLLWEAAAFGSWGRLFTKALTSQGQKVSHSLCICFTSQLGGSGLLLVAFVFLLQLSTLR